MQKYYCDKCNSEMKFDSITIEYSETGHGKDRSVSLNLCSNCKRNLQNLLNGFIHDFFGDDKRLEEN